MPSRILLTMRIEAFAVGPLLANAYVLVSGGEAAVLDPGGFPPELRQAVDGTQVRYVLLTHGHFDHADGALAAHEHTQAPIAYHSQERDVFWAMGQKPPPLGLEVADGHRLALGEEELVVWHLPGHSPGSVAYLWHKGKTVWVGDVVFSGSVGRSDLPGGDWNTLERSLTRLLELEDDWRVLPGHGPASTIGEERRSNPFLRGLQSGAG